MHNCSMSFNSLSDGSMGAAEKQNTAIPLLENYSVTSDGVRGWHLIRSRAAMIFCLTTSLVALISPFPVPQYFRSARVIENHPMKVFSFDCQWRSWLLHSKLSIIMYCQQIRFLYMDWRMPNLSAGNISQVACLLSTFSIEYELSWIVYWFLSPLKC